MRLRRAVLAGLVLAATTATAAQAAPELSTSDRLADRRYVAASERAQIEGFQDGRFYANGWHITGEMGGIWTPPLKLRRRRLVRDRRPVGRPGAGVHERLRLHPLQAAGHGRASRSSAPTSPPTGRRAGLFRLKLTNPGAARTVTFKVDAHSELLPSYPWGFDGAEPNASQQLADTGSFDGDALVFRDQGTLPHPNATPHDYAALVGSSLKPSGGETGAGHCGPQPGTGARGTTRRRCRASATTARSARARAASCATRSTLPAGGSKTVWVAVAGSDKGLAPARAELAEGARRPGRPARRRRSRRARSSTPTRSSRCPATSGSPRASTGASRTWPTSRSSPRTCRSATSTRARRTRSRRARRSRRAGSAPASPTTRGSSPRTRSTRRSRASRPASSRRSRTTCARCATSPTSSTSAPAR